MSLLFRAQVFAVTCAISVFSVTVHADDLPRRASWGASVKKLPDSPGVEIKSLQDGSALLQAGLRQGDVLLSVNGRLIQNSHDWYDLSDALVAQPTELRYRRDTTTQTTTAHFSPIPLEQHTGITTDYEAVTSNYDIRQRLIITRPTKVRDKVPAIVVLQGLSCTSIEARPGRRSHWIRLLTDLVEKSGMAVMRVEKPGVGDSEGNCSQTDFHTELDGYETAIAHFLSKDFVDPQKVIVYGNSMGSALAPYIANKFNLAGVISDGTYLRTWFEHMLEIERRIREINGDTQAEISRKMMQAYIPLYYGMLIEKKSYQQVIDENPLLAEYNYHGGHHMYGRPMSFYHQLQDFDIPAAWEQLKVPARIRWGTNDWIMTEQDNDLIIRILQANGHQDHQLYKYPKMDHWLAVHDSYASSYNGQPGIWEDKMSQQIIDWARDMVK